ncbi:MAG: DUF3592 domain-containing protein, partial [Sneathiella sp.]
MRTNPKLYGDPFEEPEGREEILNRLMNNVWKAEGYLLVIALMSKNVRFLVQSIFKTSKVTLTLFVYSNVMDAFFDLSDGVFNSAPSLVGIGCIFGGFGFLAFGAVYLRSALKARSWVEGNARILSVAVKEHVFKHERSYSVDIQYEFDAAGQVHLGDKLDLTSSSDKRRNHVQYNVDQLSDYIKQCRSVSVFYDPADPTNSALIRDFKLSHFVAM